MDLTDKPYHNMELILPTTQYKDSFIQAVIEYQAEDSADRRDIYELKVDELRNDFSSYVSKLHSEAEGKNLPKGYVPQTTYWLVDGGEFIGRVSIRHTLTDFLLREGGHIGYDIRPSKRKQGYGRKILELSLPKARELGIDKALVTCNASNIGSKKIIETCGGIFENKLSMGDGKPDKLRYWISTYKSK